MHQVCFVGDLMNIIDAERIWAERNHTIDNAGQVSKHKRREILKAGSVLINNYKLLCEYYMKKYGPIKK